MFRDRRLDVFVAWTATDSPVQCHCLKIYTDFFFLLNASFIACNGIEALAGRQYIADVPIIGLTMSPFPDPVLQSFSRQLILCPNWAPRPFIFWRNLGSTTQRSTLMRFDATGWDMTMNRVNGFQIQVPILSTVEEGNNKLSRIEEEEKLKEKWRLLRTLFLRSGWKTFDYFFDESWQTCQSEL